MPRLRCLRLPGKLPGSSPFLTSPTSRRASPAGVTTRRTAAKPCLSQPHLYRWCHLLTAGSPASGQAGARVVCLVLGKVSAVAANVSWVCADRIPKEQEEKGGILSSTEEGMVGGRRRRERSLGSWEKPFRIFMVSLSKGRCGFWACLQAPADSSQRLFRLLTRCL